MHCCGHEGALLQPFSVDFSLSLSLYCMHVFCDLFGIFKLIWFFVKFFLHWFEFAFFCCSIVVGVQMIVVPRVDATHLRMKEKNGTNIVR